MRRTRLLLLLVAVILLVFGAGMAFLLTLDLNDYKSGIERFVTRETGGAAAATAGVSLLVTSIWNRVFKSADPCAAIVKEANKKRQKKNKRR